MPKNKPNKGLLKRIRITKSGRIKIRRAGGRHLRSHKSAKLRRDYRKNTYATPSETRRVCSMLFISPKLGKKQSGAEAAEAAS